MQTSNMEKIGLVGAVLMIGSLVFMAMESAVVNTLITHGGYFPIVGLLLFILGIIMCGLEKILHAKIREEVFICCHCKEEFPDLKEYRKHYFEKLREGDNKHDNWFSLFIDRKRRKR